MASTLLERIAAGDRSAIAECMDRYGNLAWSLALRMSPTRADAEDAVQEIFIDLWGKAVRFDPAVAAEVTFVSMIARRKLIDRFRTHRRQPTETLDDAAVATLAADVPAPEARAEAARAAKALEELKPEQRRVLKLSIYDGMSHGDIARSLGMPLGTVKTHIRQGLLRIRQALDVGRMATRRSVTP